MTQYLTRRLIQTLPVVILTSIGVFMLLRLVPGDPALIYAGPDAPREVVEAVRRDMGLDQPLPVQYVIWLQHVLSGDLGLSLASKYPVGELIAQRLPATVELTGAAFLLALVISLPTGIVSALRPRTGIDFGLTVFSTLSLAVPNFWLGILLIILLSLRLGWLPSGGRVMLAKDPLQALHHLLLPAFTLSLSLAAEFSRFLKCSMLEVLQEHYIRTARAKGLREVTIVVHHALRNALVPLVTVLGVRFGQLLGGAVIVESVFTWPGVGRLLLVAIQNRDYTVVQGTLLLLVMGFVLVNLFTDILYGFLDPRVRLGARGSQS